MFILAFCFPLSANGNVTHLWITEQAIFQLPEGDLKDLLKEQTDAWSTGSGFPDGGCKRFLWESLSVFKSFFLDGISAIFRHSSPQKLIFSFFISLSILLKII